MRTKESKEYKREKKKNLLAHNKKKIQVLPPVGDHLSFQVVFQGGERKKHL